MSNFDQFQKGLDQHILRTFHVFLTECEAEDQAITSKHLQFDQGELKGELSREKEEIRLKFPKIFSRKNLLKYSILSWYMPFLTRFELQEVIRRKAEAAQFSEIKIYLHSKKVCAFALFRETDYSLNNVFGNILQKGIFINLKDDFNKNHRIKSKDFCYLTLQRKPKVLIAERKRGYNDHGSLPSDSERNYKEVNRVYGNLHFLEIEQKRLNFQILSDIRLSEILLRFEGID